MQEVFQTLRLVAAAAAATAATASLSSRPTIPFPLHSFKYFFVQIGIALTIGV